MIDARLLRLPGVRRIMGILGVLTVIQAIVIVGQGHYLAAAIVHLWRLAATAGLWPLVIGFAALFGLRQVLTAVRGLLAERFARRLTGELRDRWLQQVYVLGPQLVAQAGTGQTVTTGLDGMLEVETYLELIVSKLLNMAIIPWIVVGYIMTQSLKAGVALLLLFPVVILFMIILGYAARDRAESQYSGYMQLANHFVDALRGLTTLRFLGIADDYGDNVYQVSEAYRKQTMGVLRIAMLSSFAMDFFATLAIAVVAVFLGIDLLNGTQQLYSALVALILAPEYFMPIREFGNDYHATLNGKNALAAVFAVLETKRPQTAPALPDFTWTTESQLAVSHLDFAYAERTGLHDLNFTLNGHQNVAIIGASGAGKSTLINLLGGFMTPAAGTPFALNGERLATMNQPDWQAHLSYIPQAPYLFADTIAANVSFYQPQATPEQVQAAVEAAGLSAWLETLPAGLATRIGEGGRGISGGQAQRIALARTLLDEQRAVWLFDEPTAHLDIETEAALKATMTPLFADHLVVMATHRLHWLSVMDQVIVMDEGRVVAQGAPAELAAHSTVFQRLAAQMGGDQIAQ